jgi:hypothetical protein
MNPNILTTTVFVIQAAETRTLRACIEAGFRELGLREIEGLPISQWIAKRQQAELELVLLATGDKNPALYDAIQSAIAEAVKKSKSG